MVLGGRLDDDCMTTFRYELSAAWLLLPWLRCAQASIGVYQHQLLSVKFHQGEIFCCSMAMASGPKVNRDCVDSWFWVSVERGISGSLTAYQGPSLYIGCRLGGKTR